jgi:hypothetical protein
MAEVEGRPKRRQKQGPLHTSPKERTRHAPTRAARKHVIALAALTGCACGTGDAAEPTASPSATSKGAVTREQAAKILDPSVIAGEYRMTDSK